MSARINKRKDNKKKILVVEDEPDMTMVITHFLRYAGYEVLTAANGEEGLEKAGKGSTFGFTLPKREATSENEKSAATATARKQASIFRGTAI